MPAFRSNTHRARHRMKLFRAAYLRDMREMGRMLQDALSRMADKRTDKPETLVDCFTPPAIKQTTRSIARAKRAEHITARQIETKEWRQLKTNYVQALRETSFGATSTDVKATQHIARRNWKKAVSFSDGGLVGLFNGANMIGLCQISCKTSSTAEVGSLWVKPAYRGLGLSEKLTTPVLEWLRHHPDIEYLTANHVSGNLASRAEHLRAGFNFTHDEKRQDGAVIRHYRMQVRNPIS